MVEPFTQIPLCPVLIGRDPQLAALTRLLALTLVGKGQIAVVSGEAGIGKSRLVAEMTEQANAQGFRLWRGSCFETDHTLPYALVLDLLRSDPDEAKPSEALLAWLVEQRSGTAGQAEENKRRWFETLLHLFVVPHPQLIICEDLHWADEASLEFLALLARQVGQQPILLLLTYRSEEVTPGLIRLLALLDRQRLTTELSLAPLTELETDQMVRLLFQQRKPIRSEFLYTIHSLSEGNPFLIEEILKALVATGDIFQSDGAWERKPLGQLRIPRTVQAALQSRVLTLSGAARRLLRLAAVIGRRFDFSVLQRISDSDEPTLIEALRELLNAQLVVEENAESFTFRHALIRAAVYNDLLQRERSALHLRIGSAVETLHRAPEHDPTAEFAAHRVTAPALLLCADLAYHFYEAGQWQKALRYTQQAGEWAQRLDAPRSAVIHFTHAIHAAQKLDPQAPIGHFLYARGQAAERLGEFEPARLDYEAALAEARSTATIQAAWQNLLALGFLWTARNYQQADGYFQAALQLAHQQDDPGAMARTLNRIGNWYLNADEPQTALTYHQEALARLQQINDPSLLAETLDLLGTAAYYGGDLQQAIQHYQAAIAHCRAIEQRSTLVSVLLLFAAASGPNYLHDTLLYPPPNHQAAACSAAEALSLCRTMQWHQREAFVLAYLAWRAGAHGQYAQAFAQAERAVGIAAESEFHQVAAALALALLHWDVGDYAQAHQFIERAQQLAEQVGALLIRRFVDASQARILIAMGQVGQAELLLQQACPATTAQQTPPQRLLWLAWADLWLATGQPEQACAVVQSLLATQPVQDATRAIPLLELLLGESLLALRRFDEAEAALQKAHRAALAYAALPLSWRSAAALARLYRLQRRSPAAEAMIAHVHATIQALSSQLPTDALRRALQELVQARLPAPKPPTSRQLAKQSFAGLTARERQVALLVAQGKSNLAIAHHLTLTERTVESHISNILAKLNFNKRSQIAAWAVAQELKP